MKAQSVPLAKSLEEKPSTDPSDEKEKDSKKSKSSLGEKLTGMIKKAGIALIAALFIVIGGPVGIILGGAILAFLFGKPIFKLVKKGLGKLVKKGLGKRSSIDLSEQASLTGSLGEEPSTDISKERRKERKPLELDRRSLKHMQSKPDGVSVTRLPDDRSKATSNGDKFVAVSDFREFRVAQVKLSDLALKRRNSLPSRKKAKPLALARSKSEPNLRKPSVFKLK